MATSFASSSTATSTSHANTNNYVYDVFLNHRGPDVKKGLASHIYHRLVEHGLRVFLDSEEMQSGEELTPQIKGAIQTASVHVAIFSAGYAYSHWCLEELVLMVKTDKTIIPVFYDVHPSELRWTQARDGLYARAMSILQCILQCTWGEDGSGGYSRGLRMLAGKTRSDPQTNKKTPRHDSNTIENWRRALSHVAGISGIELNACNNDEGLFVNKIIQRVLEKVSKTPLNVAIYPTGLGDKVKELKTIISSQQQGGNLATAVGIVGLGGVGKTTLAKQFFNNERSNYEGSCFLSDVRENAARNSLNSLQAQLLEDLAGRRNVQINTADGGIEVLKRYLPSSRRALIVLDDLDHIDQLHKLFLPLKYTINSSSLILVTSRNKDVLISAEIVESSIYTLKGLNLQHSEELFCSHAFNQTYPVIGFEQLVKKYLDACHGLPLSLKVIGALLCGKRDLHYWEKQLHKISKILPTDIQSSLQISYDGLDEEEKKIFLDIACFFIGIDRDTAIRIWDGSSWEGWLGLRNLENRCLVEVDSENRIRMHDHLRDLGRDLAKHSEYPRRLWRLDNLDDLCNHSFVRGIHMVHGNAAEQSFETLERRYNLSRLKLLRAEGDFVERVFSDVGHSPQLIYLHWDNCPCSSLPSSIPLKNLRVLIVDGGRLKTLWEHESQAPLELREMVICGKIKMIPKSIENLKHLEKIVLSTHALQTLPDSIGNLANLQSLDLSGCGSLRMLPDSVGKMRNLQSLDLRGCTDLQMLPESVGHMMNLRSLVLRLCMRLEMLPDSVGNLTNLRSLHLTECYGLQTLPDSFGNVTNLQSLCLTGCFRLQMLPDSLGNVTSLRILHLDGCSSLQMLPDLVGNLTNLQSLDLRGCSGLQMLPDSVGNMTNLQSLDLGSCSGLQMLPDSVGKMRNLQNLELRSCSHLQKLPDSIGNMTSLQNLDLGMCSRLQKLPDSVGNMTNLQRLCGSSGLQMLPDSVGNMTNLQNLDLGDCSRLQKLPDSVGNLTNLQSLSWLGFSGLQKLPDSIGNLTNLQNLHLLGSSGLLELPDSVGNMTNLQKLFLDACSGLQTLPYSVGNMRNLQSLSLSGCSGLQLLPDSVGNMTNLQSLDLGRCSSLQMLPDSVGKMRNLKSLKLGGCSGLQMLPASFGNMRNLESLKLDGCSGLQMLPDSFGNMRNLESLELGRCSDLKMLPDSVGNLRNLQKLDLHGCSALQMPPIVEHLSSLKILDVSECPKLQWGAGVVQQLRQRLNTGFIEKRQESESRSSDIDGARLVELVRGFQLSQELD